MIISNIVYFKKSGQTIILYHYCGCPGFFLKQTLYTNVVSCAKRSQNLESYLMQDPVQIVHKEMVHFGAMEIANG